MCSSDLRQDNPNIVYVSATGYGSDGPHSHRPNAHPVPGAGLGGAYYQAGGAPAMVVSDDIEVLRETARQLMRANEVNPDPNTSLVIATAAMLGLYVQRTQGIGQHIQCNMMGANAYANFDDFVSYEGKPERPNPLTGLYGLNATYRLYPAASGWVFLACPSQHEWRNMVRTMGADALLDDARFAPSGGNRQGWHFLAVTDPGKRAALADAATVQRVTGYVVGGVSPLGSRRALPTVIDASALRHATILVSAGQRGLSIELAPADLQRLAAATVAPIHEGS